MLSVYTVDFDIQPLVSLLYTSGDHPQALFQLSTSEMRVQAWSDSTTGWSDTWQMGDVGYRQIHASLNALSLPLPSGSLHHTVCSSSYTERFQVQCIWETRHLSHHYIVHEKPLNVENQESSSRSCKLTIHLGWTFLVTNWAHPELWRHSWLLFLGWLYFQDVLPTAMPEFKYLYIWSESP